ncbi:CAP domain-containing protein [Streptomyces sp. NPDC001508]|uniref:CAP domain-containing protein n=1 Tax=Streptomyces sp. NPDC001508 TaxID=3154656 RepID=UPI00331694AD
MGRHRRSAAGRAAGRTTGVTPPRGSAPRNPDSRYAHADGRAPLGVAPYLDPGAYTAAGARSTAYLYATDDGRDDGYGPGPDDGYGPGADPGDGPGADGRGFFAAEFSPADDDTARERGHRREKKAATPVRTGLLGVSAAVALGTVAVATGVVPGLGDYTIGGTDGSDKVQADGVPGNTATEQGGTSGSAEPGRDTGRGTGPGTPRSTSPAPSEPASSAPAPSRTATTKPTATATPTKPQTERPSAPAAAEPAKPTKRASAPATVSAQAAAEAEVLRLVNEERAKVGCDALTANGALARLAEAFSEDMAARDFFDHTDPDGATPWDRATAAGVTGLGGENIARGQADAAAVMAAWMDSPGHRANILNCDFKTLGVGVHFASGGPWWTQDFGY